MIAKKCHISSCHPWGINLDNCSAYGLICSNRSIYPFGNYHIKCSWINAERNQLLKAERWYTQCNQHDNVSILSLYYRDITHIIINLSAMPRICFPEFSTPLMKEFYTHY